MDDGVTSVRLSLLKQLLVPLHTRRYVVVHPCQKFSIAPPGRARHSDEFQCPNFWKFSKHISTISVTKYPYLYPFKHGNYYPCPIRIRENYGYPQNIYLRIRMRAHLFYWAHFARSYVRARTFFLRLCRLCYLLHSLRMCLLVLHDISARVNYYACPLYIGRGKAIMFYRCTLFFFFGRPKTKPAYNILQIDS